MKKKEKQSAKQKNLSKKKQQHQNRKRLNNKVLKAKEIIAKNRATDDSAALEIPRRKKNLRIFRKVFFWIVIVLLAATLVVFVLVRANGNTPTVFGYSIQRVSSGSMSPTLEVGDLFFSKDVGSPDEIEVGDIITFKGGSDYAYNNVTHRVIKIPGDDDGEYYYITKGDANEKNDGRIAFSDVQSKLVSKTDTLKKVYDVFLSPWGLLIFIAVLILIYFDELLTLAKVMTGNYREEDDEEYHEAMERERKEEEKKRQEEERRNYKRQNWKKYDNTSRKKKKNRKKNKNGKERVDRFL